MKNYANEISVFLIGIIQKAKDEGFDIAEININMCDVSTLGSKRNLITEHIIGGVNLTIGKSDENGTQWYTNMRS